MPYVSVGGRVHSGLRWRSRRFEPEIVGAWCGLACDRKRKCAFTRNINCRHPDPKSGTRESGTAPTVKQTKPENRKRKLNRQTKTNRSLTGGFHIPYGNGKSIKVYPAPPIRATIAPTFRLTAYGWSKCVWSDDLLWRCQWDPWSWRWRGDDSFNICISFSKRQPYSNFGASFVGKKAVLQKGTGPVKFLRRLSCKERVFHYSLKLYLSIRSFEFVK